MWARFTYFLLESKSTWAEKKGLGRGMAGREGHLGRSTRPLGHKEHKELPGRGGRERSGRRSEWRATDRGLPG